MKKTFFPIVNLCTLVALGIGTQVDAKNSLELNVADGVSLTGVGLWTNTFNEQSQMLVGSCAFSSGIWTCSYVENGPKVFPFDVVPYIQWKSDKDGNEYSSYCPPEVATGSTAVKSDQDSVHISVKNVNGAPACHYYVISPKN